MALRQKNGNKQSESDFEIFKFHSFSEANLIEKLKKDFTSVIVNPAKYSSHRLKDMAEKIKKYYLGDKPVSVESVEKIADVSVIYKVLIL